MSKEIQKTVHKSVHPNLCARCKGDAKRYTGKDQLAFLRVLCRSDHRTMTGGQETETLTCPHRFDKPLPKFETVLLRGGKVVGYSTT